MSANCGGQSLSNAAAKMHLQHTHRSYVHKSIAVFHCSRNVSVAMHFAIKFWLWLKILRLPGRYLGSEKKYRLYWNVLLIKQCGINGGGARNIVCLQTHLGAN